MSQSRITSLLAALAVLVAPGVTAAVDGVVEINQAKALAGGVTPGDAPGFPVVIDTSGSYVLTSNLTLPDENTTGVTIEADRVSLDLNGFGVVGPVTCSGSTGSVGCSASGGGIGVVSGGPVIPVESIEVRNGFVSGPGDDCVRLTPNSILRDVRIESCGGDGVFATGPARVLDSAIRRVGGAGISVASGTVSIRGNSITVAGTQTIEAGVREIGGNECDDGRCTFPRKRYYLTQGTVQGDQTLTECAAGFHMASLWEIHDPTQLVYDLALGETTGDQGQGPLTSLSGWIRTGWVAVGTATAGVGNCNAWSTTSGAGSVANLDNSWEDGVSDDVHPWDTFTLGCGSNLRVWCVQD